MQLPNIPNVNSEQSKKVLDLLRWKLEKRERTINEVQIARLLDININNATDIIQAYCNKNILTVEMILDCPQCCNSYTIKQSQFGEEIICADCGCDFIPNRNKRLMKYLYLINEQSCYLTSKTESSKPIESIITKIIYKEDYILSHEKVKIFLSYTHKDEDFKNKLDVHFSPLKRNDKIETWNDREILAGTSLDDEIDSRLEEYDIIILLISADFISSNYCYDIEMKKALERRENNEVKVIPIIVRPCLWQDTPIGKIMALPKDGKPISNYQNEDDAYLEIVQEIKKVIDNF